MEVILIGDRTAIVHLDIDEAGVDAIHSRAESFKKHDGKLQRV